MIINKCVHISKTEKQEMGKQDKTNNTWKITNVFIF